MRSPFHLLHSLSPKKWETKSDSPHAFHTLYTIIPALVWGFFLFVLIGVNGRLSFRLVAPHLLWLIVAGVITVCWIRKTSPPPPTPEPSSTLLAPFLLIGFLCVYLLSTHTLHRWFFYLNWAPQEGERFLKSGLAKCCMGIAVLTPLMLWRPRWTWVLLLAGLLYFQYRSTQSFLMVTQGRIFQSDHPAFMMRLHAFRETFPQIIYYNPLWNAGQAAPYILASGITSVGLLLWPLWVFGDMLEVYTPGIAAVFLFIVPLLVMGSIKLAGGKAVAITASGLFALGISQYNFMWAVHFGTIGAAFCSVFLLPVSILIQRLLWRDSPRITDALLLPAAAFFYLLWPPSAIMALPLIPACLWGLPQLKDPGRLKYFSLATLLLLVLVTPLLLNILTHTDPRGFSDMKTLQPEGRAIWLQGWNKLGAHASQAHPVLLFLGIAGVWVLPRKPQRTYFGTLLIGLALLAGWGEVWKPQFQLARTGIPLLYVAIAPASLWIEKLILHRDRRFTPLKALLCMLVLLGGDAAHTWYRGRGSATIRGMREENFELADWIKREVPEGGRIMFAGPTVHGYGGAQVSYLPLLAEREMMACDYYNFSPKRVEYDYAPRIFRENDRTMLEFMNLYNVTHIITYHANWMAYYDSRPEYFKRVHTFGPTDNKYIWRVRRKPDVFLRGQGHMEAGINTLTVYPEPGEEELILRYHWADGMTAEPPAHIEPYPAGFDVVFIRLQPHGSETCLIRYRK